ncbi:MAG: PD-(D/E)XK nuclease family protein [Calditrichaeota bacterium]|nr:PD-(D/E)XK nuclease family protein [Calditrichota bacterium]
MKQLNTGQIQSLEKRLPDKIRELQQHDPFAEVRVIVPNQITRLHLRRRVTGALGQTANIQFFTLHDYARSIAEPLLLSEGWQTLGEGVVEPLLMRIVDQHAQELRYVGKICDTAGFRRALLRTRQELLLHKIEPDDLLRIETYSREQAAKLKDVALLLAAFDRELRHLRWHDAPLLMQLALRAAPGHSMSAAPLLLYALYDLPPLSRSLLERCFGESECAAFLPFEDTEEYAFVRPLRQWYLHQGFAEERFELSDCDLQYRFVSAPHSTSAATEVVRDILFPAEADVAEIGVVVPPGGPFGDVLRSRCREAGLSPFVYEARTLGETQAGRGLAALVELLDGKYHVRQMSGFLSTVPFEGIASQYAAEWHRFGQEARILESESEWIARITQLLERTHFRAERLSEGNTYEEASLAELQRREQSLNEFLTYLRALFAALQSCRRAATWSEAIGALWDYFVSIAVIDEEFADIALQLDQTVLLDRAGVRCTPDGIRNFMTVVLTTPGKRFGTFGRNQPLVAAREQCFGVTFDMLAIPGCNEGVIPRTDTQDPLLLDSDRDSLNKQAENRVPLRREWEARERFWFAVLQSSARKTLYFYASRADDQGRPQLLSPYLMEVLRAQCGEAVDAAPDELFMNHSLCRFAPAHPLAGSRDHAISEAEFHRNALNLALEQQDTVYLAELWQNAEFKLIHEAERSRFGTLQFGKHEGYLTETDVRQQLAHRISATQTTSVTALEEYWKCPFRYFVHRELEAYAPESVSGLEPVTRRDFGTLLHKILQKYHGERIDKPHSEEHFDWTDLQRTAEEELKRFGRTHSTGPLYMQQRLRNEVFSTLKAYHDHLLGQSGAWNTRFVEASFGQNQAPFPEPLILSTKDGEQIRVQGRIDRLDESADSKKILLTDYKTGKTPNKTSRSARRRLQLGVYAELAAQQRPGSDVQAAYLRMNSNGVGEEYEPADQSAAQVAIALAHDIRSGIFVPDADAKDFSVCKNCFAKLACGATRHGRKGLNSRTVNGLQTERGAGGEGDE